METPAYAKGLEGVVAAESQICRIDGEIGKLYYVGYSIEDLVAHCTFEEVTYLLLYGELPNASQLMEDYLLRLSEKQDDFRSYEILKEIEAVFRERMEEKGRPIYPNVDFFSGAVYLLLGIEPILFTPLFAAGRVAGWLAHILEQRVDNRLFRPRALYSGHELREFVPIEGRE